MLGREEFDLMEDSTVLVNTARGQIVDEDALVEALRDDRLVAGLDVFETEPLPASSRLQKFDNVVTTPRREDDQGLSLGDDRTLAANALAILHDDRINE